MTRPFLRGAIAAASALGAAAASSQDLGAAAPPATAASAVALAPVVVVGRPTPGAGVTGWGDLPLARTPVQAAVFGSAELKENGVQRLADVVRIDPAASVAYDAIGYIDYLTVRGFVLDNRYNYRRDGLPVSAETSIPLDNKSQLEIVKGTSGIEAGTGAPGGLVNYVVKRPLDRPLRSAFVEWREGGNVLGSVDLSQRFGVGEAFGVRVNAALERIAPQLHAADGTRRLFAVAGDWRLGADTRLEAEVETSRRSQPSQPGFSLLGGTLPAPGDPRVNLNNQPWSLPVVFDATTASLRWQQRLGADWRFVVHAATQRLRTDDRTAFPFGCTAEGNFDRYCSDGTFDLYDYRSENERRRSDVIDVSLHGRAETGALRHALSFGVQRSSLRARFEGQIYTGAGTGNVEATAVTPPGEPTISGLTNRDEHSTELQLRDAIALTERTTAWLGVRHSRIDRRASSTDPADAASATAYRQPVTSPFVAVSHAYAPGQFAYASWSRGAESAVAPNLPVYTNAGRALPALKSRQLEVGLKGGGDRSEWGIAWFDIARPLFGDVFGGRCAAMKDCRTLQHDGEQRHRGVEASGALHAGPWDLRAGAQWLHARREGGDPALDGLEPTNVPSVTLRLDAGYRVQAVPGLAVQAALSRESGRRALPDNSVRIAGYTRVDAAARYATTRDGRAWTLRAGLDNVLDKRAWQESPYQFGHVYLYPLAPRTLRVSLQVDL